MRRYSILFIDDEELIRESFYSWLTGRLINLMLQERLKMEKQPGNI